MIYPSYCFSASDIYDTFDKTQLKIRRDVVQSKYGVNKKQLLCASVLVYCFYLIILDIIENNVTFVLPLFNGKYASISIKAYTGEDLKKARQRGAFSDVDLLRSNFAAYKVVYTWKYGNIIVSKPCVLSKRLKEMLYENVYNGKVYY